MAKLSIAAGATSQSINIFIQDSSKTTGAGLTGLVYNSSGLVAYYTFTGTGTAAVAIPLVTLAAANSAYSSGGFKEISSANMPGLYRLDIPNAAIAASNGRSVVIMLSGATNMAPCVLEIELTAIDNQSTAFGLSLAKTTNITGFNDIAASAIVSGGAITTSSGAVSTVTTVTNQLTAAAIATGVWQDTTAGDFTVSSSIGKSLYTSGNAPGAASGLALVGSNMGTVTSVTGAVGSVTSGVTVTTNNDKTGYSLSSTQTFNNTGTWTGNLTGSVGSVTGAVTVGTMNSTACKFKTNTAHANFCFTMQDSTTGADKTGLTVTGTVAIDGGTFSSLTNSVTEMSNGWYKVNLAAADLNGTNIALKFTATGAITKDILIETNP